MRRTIWSFIPFENETSFVFYICNTTSTRPRQVKASSRAKYKVTLSNGIRPINFSLDQVAGARSVLVSFKNLVRVTNVSVNFKDRNFASHHGQKVVTLVDNAYYMVTSRNHSIIRITIYYKINGIIDT